jgi:hypothetical protein
VRPRLPAPGPRRGGQLRDPSLVAALPFGRLGLQPRLGLLQAGQSAAGVGELDGELVTPQDAVLAVLGLVDLGGLPQDLGDLLLQLGEGAVSPISGVGGHPGAVQCDQAEPDHAGGFARLEQSDQEVGQGLPVADAEAGDGYVVGGVVGGQDPKCDVLGQASFDLAGGAHADPVGVQQHPQQGLGVIGGVAVPVIPVRPVERGYVQLVDHVEDEPGEVAGWQPVAQVQGQQEGLVALCAQEVVGHGACLSVRDLSAKCVGA